MSLSSSQGSSRSSRSSRSSPLLLPDEAATRLLGACLAPAGGGVSIYLHGALGTGKTTLVRGLLGALGHVGPVRSPTYTLVESYRPGALYVHHFDLYRLEHPEELEWLGFRDYPAPDALCLVEWPQCAAQRYGPAHLEVFLEHRGAARAARLEVGRGEGMCLLPPVWESLERQGLGPGPAVTKGPVTRVEKGRLDE